MVNIRMMDYQKSSMITNISRVLILSQFPMTKIIPLSMVNMRMMDFQKSSMITNISRVLILSQFLMTKIIPPAVYGQYMRMS